MPDKVLLGDLEIGDKFIPLSKYTKRTPIYVIVWRGSATRQCKNLHTGKTESKSCRMEVVKLNK